MSKNLPDWALMPIRALLDSLEIKDEITYLHSCRVALLCRDLAKWAGLSEEDQLLAELAGLFHDIGKIGVPDAILNKPSRLSAEEALVMAKHPEWSHQIVKHFSDDPIFEAILPGILHHHERMDGKGYPHRLKGEEIPFLARLILVVDTYDAMTSNRPYRQGLTSETAYKELHKYSGTQFDKKLATLFIETHSKKDETESTESLIFAKILALPTKKRQNSNKDKDAA